MYTIGYDLGSSSLKVALVNSNTGEKVALIQEPISEMEILTPQKNWAEQDPNQWWAYFCSGTKRLIEQARINPSEIKAIGIAYQMHGLVVVDRVGKSLRNAIIWCDSRAVQIGKDAYEKLGHDYCGTHLLNAPGNFTASKLKWVQTHEPEVYAQVYKCLLPGDFIALKLTGEATSTINGLSEGTLWDYKENKIASKLMDHYNLNPTFIPRVVPNFQNQGMVTKIASQQSGLPEGIPIQYRAGDQPNNALALHVFKPGEVAVTGGTSGVIYAVTDHLSPKEISKVNHFAHVNYTEKKPVIGRLLNINGAGIQYRWLKKICGASSYEEMNDEAGKIPVGSDGVVVLPFGNGAERMFDNKTIGTHICNLNLNTHGNGHLYRAALEGIAFSFMYGMEILKTDQSIGNVIRTGNDNLFRAAIFSETVATLIGQEIEIYDTTGAVGAAHAASVSNGDFDKLSGLLANDLVKTVKPLSNKTIYQKAYEHWKNELEIKLIER